MREPSYFGFTEPVINGVLAGILCGKGLLAGAELKVRVGTSLRKPDIPISLQGFRVILEGKLESNTAQSRLESQCLDRIREGLCDISIGVVYHLPQPSGQDEVFAEFTMTTLQTMVSQAEFDVAVWGPGVPDPTRLKSWTRENLDGLAAIIRESVYEAHRIDTLKDAVERIEATLDAGGVLFLQVLSQGIKGLSEKLAPHLELPQPKGQKEWLRTLKIALLVLLDAAIFYNIIQPKIQRPRQNQLSTIDALKQKHGGYISAFKNGFKKALQTN